MRRSTVGRVALALTGLAIVPMVVALRAQSPAISLTLTGQSMIRSDIRVHTSDVVSTWARLLKADVVFTNFESTVVEKGEPLTTGRFLTPPEALDALHAMGFNLLSLANNHAFDMKVPGIHHALEETSRRHIVRAGTGNTIEEAAAPAYLKTSKGTVALVAIASGLVAEGGSATGIVKLRRIQSTEPQDTAIGSGQGHNMLGTSLGWVPAT